MLRNAGTPHPSRTVWWHPAWMRRWKRASSHTIFPMSKSACSLKTRLKNTEQAKAGLPDAAWRTIAEARAAGLPLSARLYNLLIMAHARAGRAEAAEAIVHSDMAADGVAPDLVTWWVFMVRGLQGFSSPPQVLELFHRCQERPGMCWYLAVLCFVIASKAL